MTITGAASCSRTAGETVGGSPYTITCAPGTLSAANYSFQTGSTGTLTITKATLSVNADPATKTYGDVDPALTYTFSGFQFSDNASNSGITGLRTAHGPWPVVVARPTRSPARRDLVAANYSFVTGSTAELHDQPPALCR